VIVWRVRGKLSGLFCAVLCATVVHSAMHTHMNRPDSCLLVRSTFLWLYCVLHKASAYGSRVGWTPAQRMMMIVCYSLSVLDLAFSIFFVLCMRAFVALDLEIG